MKKEQKYFDDCRETIRQNIQNYEEKAEQGKRETEALYAAVTSGDVELYNQLIVSKDIQEHNERQLKKNQAAYEKPYFGRIDYREEDTGQQEQLYIGKNGISKDKTEVLIVDWRAPVSTLYYENELGQGSYEVPDIGTIPVELKLKRTFDVDNGKLLGYYDNDTAATDELLVKYLSQNKDVILGDIISTIQKEQNEIIRQSPFQNVIVQGVAGSGKTTVAMHRISYILYNYEKRFRPDEFCIIGSNDMLLHYITSGLPELDVYHVGQKRMDIFFKDLLGKEWKKKYQIQDLAATEYFKSKLDFIQALDEYLAGIRRELLEEAEVRDEDLGIILSKESIRTTLMENQTTSVVGIYRLLNERIRTRIKFLVPEDDRDYCKEKQQEYKGYFKQEAKYKNIVVIYEEFLVQYEKDWQNPGEMNLDDGKDWQSCGEMELEEKIAEWNMESVLAHLKKGSFDVYDLAALVLIQKRMTEKAFHDEYGQLIIDEAQDFGPVVYYVLKQMLHGCYFTIMGDVSQNIHYETGMNDWQDLTGQVFEPERTKFHILAKSYRNTIEISEYAGKVLEKASFGRYKIQPVIRHGVPVAFHRMAENEDIQMKAGQHSMIQRTGEQHRMIQKTAELIAEIQEKGYATIAVICRTSKEAEQVEEALRSYPEIFPAKKLEAAEKLSVAENLLAVGESETKPSNDFTKGVMILPIQLTKGLEFDSVILWNPDKEAYRNTEGNAKLLYVAITRALHELHIVYEKELTELLE